MSVAVHRRTKRLVPSGNTPDFPIVDWIINPDLSAVVGWESRYWTIDGDKVLLMSDAERAAVDKAIVDASLDLAATQLDDATHPLRALARVMINELALSAQSTNSLLTAISSSTTLADLKSRVSAISHRPVRSFADIKTAMRGFLGS